jgi:RimJ/RimL family protein N-acetyltransferase
MSVPANFLPFQTSRLVLRRFIAADLMPFLAYRNDPEVARYQSWTSFSREAAMVFINEMAHAPIAQIGEWFQVAIAEKTTNRLVGDIGLCIAAANPAIVEIGFTLARQEQGQGYACEAVRACIGRLFEAGTIHRVVGICDARNAASIKLLTRLGMVLVKTETVGVGEAAWVEHTFVLEKGFWLPVNH